MDQAAKLLDIALAGGGEHGAGSEEQQALEQRMVDHMQQRRREGERRRRSHAVRLKGKREAKADEDDADVLDRAVGEQPLKIALHERH